MVLKHLVSFTFLATTLSVAKSEFELDKIIQVSNKDQDGVRSLGSKLSNVINFLIPNGDDRGERKQKTKREKPKFCNGLDCPDFDPVSQTDDYEERNYLKSEWVSTGLTGIDFKDSQRTMFGRLFEYIQGKNDKEEKIAMTCPVITRIIPGPGPACESNFTMSFFMSPSVKDPPKPSDKTVGLTSLPEQKVFVRSFGGFATEEKWLEEAVKLGQALNKDGKKFDDSFFYSAGYNSPFKVLNRHNEVWFIEK